MNAPAIFADQQFQQWLNSSEPKFTWHVRNSEVGDYSDVVVLVDSSLNGEGSNTEMPAHIWYMIVEACKAEFGPGLPDQLSIMVRLTNLQ